MKTRRRVTLVISVSFCVTVSFFFLEVFSRIYYKKAHIKEKMEYLNQSSQGRRALQIGDTSPTLGWGLRKGAVDSIQTSEFNVEYSINSRGYRDREPQGSGAIPEMTIFALGESTVFGEGINYGERFTEIIEQALSGIEVVNMGVWGFGIDQSLLQLSEADFSAHPQYIVLFVIEAFLQRGKNVIMSGTYKPRFVLSGDRKGLILQDLSYVREHFAVQRKSSVQADAKMPAAADTGSFASLLGYISKRHAVKNSLQDRDATYWDRLNAIISRERALRGSYPQEDFETLIWLLLGRFKELAAAHEAGLLIVNIDDHRIGYLESACSALSLEYLDLSDTLARASKVYPLRFSIDPHYNPFTHRVIGEFSADYLASALGLKKNEKFTNEYLGKL